MFLNIINKHIHLAAGFLAFIVYLFTLAPSVIQIDPGELAAVQATLGIAHPTGYPLFTLAGYLFSQIPLPFTAIYQLNLLAAIWCSAGVIVFVYTIKFIFKNINEFETQPAKPKVPKKVKKKAKAIATEAIQLPHKSFEPLYVLIAGFAGGLILALNKTYWFQSTSVEVYSLHIFLMTLIILFLLKAYISKDEFTGFNLKHPWMIFALMLALGFTNHMTTLLVLPGVAYLFFNKYGFNKESFKKILRMQLVFIPVLTILYAYLPLRAAQSPLLNWGNPIDLERFLRHVSGKQYQVWIFSSMEAAKKQFVYFIDSLASEFTLMLVFSLAGLIYLLRNFKKLFIFFGLCFISTVIYSINYDISDIDAYFLLAYLSLALFAVFGIIIFIQYLKKQNIKESIAFVLITAIIAFHGVLTYKKVDQSGVYSFEDYTKELLNSVPENAVVFSYQWDYFLSASYYFQFVENFRRDVAVVDKELLRRSWYFHQMETCYPGLLDGIKPEKEIFLTALIPFERDEPYDGNVIERHFRHLMTRFVETSLESREFFIAPEVVEKEMQTGELTLPQGYTVVPDIFMFRVVKGNEYVPASDPVFNIRFPASTNIYIENIKRFVGAMLVRRALYEVQHGKKERSKVYIDKIMSDLPGFEIPLSVWEALDR